MRCQPARLGKPSPAVPSAFAGQRQAIVGVVAVQDNGCVDLDLGAYGRPGSGRLGAGTDYVVASERSGHGDSGQARALDGEVLKRGKQRGLDTRTGRLGSGGVAAR